MVAAFQGRYAMRPPESVNNKPFNVDSLRTVEPVTFVIMGLVHRIQPVAAVTQTAHNKTNVTLIMVAAYHAAVRLLLTVLKTKSVTGRPGNVI